VGGETTCQQCGLIVDEYRIGHGPEWRTFDNGDSEERVRTGGARSEARYDKGLSTKISRVSDG
jgi:transcription initiation factor TFIIB